MKTLAHELKKIIHSLPGWVLTLFVVSVVMMNLLANKSISLPVDWLALDCGILVSWLSFFTMDMIVKRFGARASILVSVLALAINELCSIIFFIASKVQGMWGESFVENGSIINIALDNTIGGTWYVLMGSAIAFLASALVNSALNQFVGERTSKNMKGYAIRSSVSTMVGQFVDNMTFALIVSMNFFGWSFLQCVTCSITGAIVELILEMIFSPIGYRITKKWEEEGIGDDYLKCFG